MDITLSPDQRRAVETTSRAVVVVAAAGSGKTEVVAQRLERLLRDADEDSPRVLALSYTVKAADELRERLRLRLGDRARWVNTETTHGFVNDLLRRYGTRVGLPREPEVLGRDEDRAELLSEWLREAGHDQPDDLREILSEVDLARARRTEAPFLDEWRAALASRGAVDYPAMLEWGSELLSSSWLRDQISTLYREIVVDEAQNLTPSQYDLLTRAIGDPSTAHINAMLVGDERQSIMGFAGADAGLIQRFKNEYQAELIRLSTNYRSAERIVAAGRRVAAALSLEPEVDQVYPAPGQLNYLELASEGAEGEHVAGWVASLLNKGIDAAALALGESNKVGATDIAVLARTAAALRATRTALESRSISVAVSISPEDWVRSPAARLTTEIIAHRAASTHLNVRRAIASLCGSGPDWQDLAAVVSAADEPSLRELKGLCDIERADDLIPYLESVAIDDPDWNDDLGQFQEVWSTFTDRYDLGQRSFGSLRHHIARSQRGDNLTDGVRLLTVHKAQGREFKAVALVACNDGQLPDFRAKTVEDRTAELRILYVAVTRASRLLLLTRSTSRETRFGARGTDPSSFLDLVLEG